MHLFWCVVSIIVASFWILGVAIFNKRIYKTGKSKYDNLLFNLNSYPIVMFLIIEFVGYTIRSLNEKAIGSRLVKKKF